LRAGVVLAAILTTASLGMPFAAAPSSLDAVRSWLEARVEGLRAADPASGRDVDAARALDELRWRLIDAGLDEPVAEGLVGARSRPAGSGQDTDLVPLIAARTRLERFSRGLSRPRPAIPADARERLGEILSDPVFRDSSDSASLAQRAQYAIQRFLGRVLGGVVRLIGSNPELATAAVVVLVLATLTFVASRVGWRLPARRRGTTPDDPVRVGESARESARLLLERATVEAGAGRWGRAVRLAEQAAVVALVARGELPGHPGMTDLEGLRSLRARGGPAESEAFEALVTLHDAVVFGGRAADASSAERARGLARRLVVPEVEEAA